MSSPAIEELLKTVKELNSKNEFRQVIELLPQKTVAAHKDTELGSELAKAFAARALAGIEGRDFDMVAGDMARAIRLDPKCAEYHFMWAYVMVSYDEPDNAIKGFTKAIEINPGIEKYFYFRGTVYRKEKRFEEAMADFDKIIELNPRHADAYIERAGIWYSKKEYDKTISDLTISIAIKPDISAAWHNRGSAWYDKKEYDKGIADLSQAILLKPDFANSYFERGLNYEGKKAYDKAIKDYSKAIKLDTTWIDPWCQRGDVWAAKKQYDKAIADYNTVLQMKRRYKGAHYKRGMVWYEIEEYNEAVNNFKCALALKPNDKEARIWLDKAEAKLRESPGSHFKWQSVRDQAASFIEQIAKDYGMKFKSHEDGFVHGEVISKWDAVKECPAWAGITGWLPAFRPDLAKWHKYKIPFAGEAMYVFTHKDTEFNPEDAGIPIDKELWEAITGKGWLPKYDEEEIGRPRKFEKVAPMLLRIAARIRLGDLDDGLIFDEE